VKEKVNNKSSIFLLVITALISVANLGFGPVTASKVKKANKDYKAENYDEAIKKYTDAQIDNPESPELFFNIADALYKQRKYAEAEQMFEKSLPKADIGITEKAYYNIGDCKYKQGNLRESIDYYKKALEVNPNNEDAKYNIEFVEKKIKEMLSQSEKRQEEQKKENQEERGEQDKKQGEQGDQGQQEKSQSETQGQEQQEQQEKTQNETQGQQGQKKEDQGQQEKQDKKQGNQGEQGDQGQQERTQQETQGQKEKAQQETQGLNQENQGQQGEPREMTKEEAEALLRMMADEEKGQKKPEDERKIKSSRYPETDKPW